MQTLQRELMEEIGWGEIDQARHLITCHTDNRIKRDDLDVGLVFSFFILPVEASFAPPLSQEHTAFEWCSLEEAAKRLHPRFPSDFLEKLKL